MLHQRIASINHTLSQYITYTYNPLEANNKTLFYDFFRYLLTRLDPFLFDVKGMLTMITHHVVPKIKPRISTLATALFTWVIESSVDLNDKSILDKKLQAANHDCWLFMFSLNRTTLSYNFDFANVINCGMSYEIAGFVLRKNIVDWVHARNSSIFYISEKGPMKRYP